MAQQLVYYLSSAEAMQADSVDTPERELLVSAAAARGIHMRTVAWDQLAQAATQAQTSHPPAWALVRSTWDYHERLPEFLAAMGQLEASGYRLLNPLPVLQWNAHKKYLAEFAAAADANAAALGHDSAIRTISTIYAATPDAETVFSAMDSFGVDDVIVKPAVGAGAWRQARVRRGDPLPDKDQLPLGQCLIQPFHAPIEKFGEYSFIFFNNQLAYAVHKQPPAGEYRTQPYFGTSHHTFLPSAKQLEQVQRVSLCGKGRGFKVLDDNVAGHWRAKDGHQLLYTLIFPQTPHYSARSLKRRSWRG